MVTATESTISTNVPLRRAVRLVQSWITNSASSASSPFLESMKSSTNLAPVAYSHSSTSSFLFIRQQCRRARYLTLLSAHPSVISCGWLCLKEAALLQGGSSRSSARLSKDSTALPTSTTSSSSTPTPLFTSIISSKFCCACKKQSQAFSFKGYHRRHQCGFPRSHHLSRRHHAECRKGGSADKNAYAARSKAGTLPFGWFSYCRTFGTTRRNGYGP